MTHGHRDTLPRLRLLLPVVTVVFAWLLLPPATTAAPLTLAVVTKGSLPGFEEKDLGPYLADRMNAAASGKWRFAPLPPGTAVPGNRVEFSIKANPYAAGSVRTYGFSRATMERLLNVHRSVTIEARLLLMGAYQTLVFRQVTVTGGPQDPALADAIAKLTRNLMAYPALDAHPVHPSSGAPFRPIC